MYWAVVLDASRRRAVGWLIGHNPTAALTSNALGMPVEQRDAARGETVIHKRPRNPVHHLGVHRAGSRVGARALDGLGR